MEKIREIKMTKIGLKDVRNFGLNFVKKIGKVIKDFYEDESAVGVVELILILVVLIGLVVIFRDQLTTIIGGIFERIATDSSAI